MDLAQFAYDGRSYTPAEVTSLDALTFSPDGIKMYVSRSGNSVAQYTLTTPWDVSTATYDGSQSLYVASWFSGPGQVAFSADGTCLFAIQGAITLSNRVMQFALSTPWDILTASYTSKKLLDYSESQFTGLAFDAEGTTLLLLGQSTDKIYEYTLATPWDLSTAAATGVAFSVAEDSYTRGLQLTGDGVEMLVLGITDPATIYRYTLTTPWDVSTASYTDSLTPAEPGGITPAAIWATDSLLVIGDGFEIIYSYAPTVVIPHADPPFIHHLWVFDPQERLRCLFSNSNPGACPYFGDAHVENVDGTETYKFSIPADHADAELVVNEGFVAFPDLDRRIRMYRIKRVVDATDSTGLRTREVSCEPLAMELLDAIVRPVTYTSQTPAAILAGLLAGTRWAAGDVDYGPVSTHTMTDYRNTWAAIRALCDATGLIPVSHVTIAGNQITGRYIDLLTAPETVTGKFLDYAKDTATIKRTGSSTTLHTAMIGLGKSKSDGSFVTFADEVWTTAGGDPANKPAEQDWVGDDTARDLYGLPLAGSANLHRVGLFQDPDQSDPAALLDAAYAKLLKENHPQFTYEVDVVSLERLRAQKPGAGTYEHERMRIGDRVAVRDLTFVPSIVSIEPVIETTRSYVDATQDKITLGTPKTTILTTLTELQDLSKRVYNSEGVWSGWTGA